MPGIKGRSRAWRARSVLLLCLLGASLAGLAVGGLLHSAGQGAAGDVTWAVVGGLGAVSAGSSLIDAMRHRRLGVDVIALLALMGALAVGEELAAAVVAVMLWSGRSLELWADGHARHDLQLLVQRSPTQARRHRDGGLETVPLDDVAVGDLLLVATGDVVPVDGIVSTRPAALDESALTGEPLPVHRPVGERVASGVVNAGQPFDFRATAPAAQSTYAGIVRLVAEAEASRPPFVRLADRVAAWFLGVTAMVAGAAWAVGGARYAVAVLVVATPCPLILAAPVAFVSGLSRCARLGVVVKGGAVLERLARCTTVVLDKTGTMTIGRPEVSAVVARSFSDPDSVLGYAASLDQVSSHPLAEAVVRAAGSRQCTLGLPAEVDEVPGEGVRGRLGTHRVAVGKASWVGAGDVDGAGPWIRSVRRRAAVDGSSTVFVGVDGVPVGAVLLNDRIRPDVARTVRAFRGAGVRRVVMLTGDRADVADAVGVLVGVDAVSSECTPADKVDNIRAESGHAVTLMVGDGINDAPALALADVGLAVGVRGASASSEAADAVLVVDHLDRVAEAKVVASGTSRIALQSVVAGMSMSLLAMGAAAAGQLPAVWGAVLQEVIDVVVILNAMRVLVMRTGFVHVHGEDAVMSLRFRHEHAAIRADLERLRMAADALGAGDVAETMRRVREVHRLLVTEVAPHEEAEELRLYPAVDRVLGGRNATAPMSRAHAEISHQIRRLGRLLDEIGDHPPDSAALVELRGMLYGLHAILALHTAQEEESYLSLADEEEEAVGKRGGTGA